MDVFEAIFTRRSIRKFTGEPVSADELHTILRAGSYAPSAHNYQPWHFLVVQDAAVLADLTEELPHSKMLAAAGCGIIVCGDSQRQWIPGFLMEDCAAAAENMLLAAHGLGLGAVWLGEILKNAEGVRAALSVSAEHELMAVVALGRPGPGKPASSRKPLAELVLSRQ
jgi:nitroreductase